MYLDHLKFCVVCINGRRYVCCSECYVVSNQCSEPTSCNLSARTVVKLCTWCRLYVEKYWRENTLMWQAILLLLLFVFRDIWKEWGDSIFQIYLQNCQFHHMRLESLEHLIVFQQKKNMLVVCGGRCGSGCLYSVLAVQARWGPYGGHFVCSSRTVSLLKEAPHGIQ